ncbi:MAG: cadmium-translocating P-type ATPase [Oscillospiraceae bacterium]|nr:cadmium-translocating P-type ATPase [Oscillospiraceae bacterium]
MTSKQKKMRTRILVTIVLYAAVFAFDRLLLPDWLPAIARLPLYIVPYWLIGWDVLRKAWTNIRHGQVFDECFLMAVATIAAFLIGEYAEATAVMLFYQIGELFQGVAVGKARASVTELMNITPEYANVESVTGHLRTADPASVRVGSVIDVKAGERVPLDGVVITGESFVDTSALTGESVPRRVTVGDEVFSGSINGDGLLRVRTTKAYEESTVAKVLELVESASEKKARLEQFITRFARVYTPVVTVSALLLALFPPIFFHQPLSEWVRRACIFLIVSCPCALVISVPLGFFGGIGAASRIGVLVKGGNYLEALADCDTLVLDKTGTLTMGNFKVTQFIPADGYRTDELIMAAAAAEAFSNHPVAESLRSVYTEPVNTSRLTDMRELPGLGTHGYWNGKELMAGNAKLLAQYGITCEPRTELGTVVHVAYDGNYMGCFVASDTIRDGAAEAMKGIKRAGVKEIVMLSGDLTVLVEGTAALLGIDTAYGELMPADKVAKLEELLDRPHRGKVAYVGDGINDAPSLMRADVGIAMGKLGSDAAIEAADIVLMDDGLYKIAATVDIARKTTRIVRENVVFALAVKFAVLILGALGYATMWLAVFGDVGVTVLAVLNSMRCLTYRKK